MKLEKVKILFLVSMLLPAFTLNASVQKLSYEEDGITGLLYQQPDHPKKQPVIVLGGSEGGIPTRLAEVIAESGHPTLAVAYFKENSLPQELEKIPLEYLETASTWLLNKYPDFNRLTIVGWSKGAELALLLASKNSTFDRVVAIAPSSVVWAGILNDWQKVPNSSWTQDDQPLPHVAFAPTGQVKGLLDLYSQSLENRSDGGSATIQAENISGEVFLYSGGNDEIWPSNSMAKSICQRMEKNKLSNCEHFNYPELDHLLNYKILDSSDSLHEKFMRSVAGG